MRKLKKITSWLFVSGQIAALVWVSLSYCIALYSTIALEQPFPVEELSRQAIETLLGITGLKVIENIFEHNEGSIFGKTKRKEDKNND